MFQDIRFGCRMLLKSKGFTLVAILSLAIGIAAGAVVFSVVDAFAFKALPVREPERLVLFRWFTGPGNTNISASGSFFRDPALGRGGVVFSKPAYEEFVKVNSTLSELFAFVPVRVSANVDGQTEIAKGMLVSGNYYAGLGVDALRGRTTTPEDDLPGADPVALISYGYWQRRFGLEASAIGRVVRVNGVGFTIIGVTPPGFYGAMKDESPADIQFPFSTLRHVEQGLFAPNDPWRFWIQVMGRLNEGATAEQATVNFQPAFTRAILEGYRLMPAELRREILQSGPSGAALAIPIFAVTPGGAGRLQTTASMMRGPLSLFVGVAVLVLLVVSTNVANLMLARGATRRQEFNVRMALGGGRWRMIRQLLTESIMLSMMAGALGIAFAYAGVHWIMITASPDLPIAVDLRILAFTMMLCTTTGILFGLAPALRTTRGRLGRQLASAGRTVRGGRSRLSKVLLVAQVAVSLILLAGAGLLVRSLQNLNVAQTGFNPANMVVFGVNPSLNPGNHPEVRDLYERIVGELEAVPGVRAATLSDRRVLSGSSNSAGILIQGRDPRRGENVELANIRSNFMDVLQIPIRLGRPFDTEDSPTSSRVAIVNETFARRYFPNTSPLGQRFGFVPERIDEFEIVGVAADAQIMRLSDEVPAMMYSPYVQRVPSQVYFNVRTAVEPSALIPAIRSAVGRIDPNLALFNVSTQADQLDSNFTIFRVGASIASGFGALALFLACVALYSVMSFGVTQRTGEIGIRVALGAKRWHVIRLVASQTAILLLIGLTGGAVAATFLSEALERQLYQVQPGDPLIMAVAILVLLLVAVAAAYLPARRAVRIDPTHALRQE